MQTIGFLGEYEATLDAKGRFLLPAGLKKQLDEESATQFVLTKGIEKCLTLYPIKVWEPIFARLSKLDDFKPKVREFRRFFLNGAIQVEGDTAGRLLVPPNLKEYAGLEKDIILVSAMNKIEIWDKNKYQQLFESFSQESFSDLAQLVMSDNNDTQS